MASQVPPKKNTAFNLGLCLYKNDGTLIANPGTITAKISKDFGDYADIGTVTEEDSTYGQIKLALTNTEMNADIIMIYVVDNTSGCVPYTATIYTSAALLDDIAGNVWDVVRSGHTGVGTFGEVSTDADVAAAVCDEALSGHTTAGTVGKVLADAATEATLSSVDGKVDVIDGIVDDILVDTGTTLDGRIPAALVSGKIDASVGAVVTNAIDAAAIKADAVTKIQSEIVEGSISIITALRAILAFSAAKASGGGTTTIVFRDTGDSKDRITMTVDANGNRSAVTLDLS